MSRAQSTRRGHSLLETLAIALMLALTLGVAGSVALLAQRASAASQGRGSLSVNAVYGLHRLVLDMEQSAWLSLCTRTHSPPHAVSFNSCTHRPDHPDDPFGLPLLSATTGSPVWLAQHVYYVWPGQPHDTLLFRRVPLPEPPRETPRRLTQAQLLSCCDGRGTPVAFGVSRLDAVARDPVRRTVVLTVTAGGDAHGAGPVVFQSRARLSR